MRVAARSEPAWGSVRFMVAAHSPLTILSSQVAFCSSLAAIISASVWPTLSWGSMAKAMLAENHISHTGVETSLGRP